MGSPPQSPLIEAEPPPEFDEYTVVLLYRAANPPVLDEEESERLQRQHLGHLGTMRREGAMITAGPVGDPRPDPDLRGVCLYRVGLDQARRLAENDPAVRRGRFRISAFTWSTPKDELCAP